MDARGYIEQLDEHHLRIGERLSDMRRLCAMPQPDLSMLSLARLRLSSDSTSRSRYIHAVIYPYLQQHAEARLIAALDDLARDLSRKRLVSSEHVTAWPLEAIRRDWSGYRTASERIARGVAARMELERYVLVPALSEAERRRAAESNVST